MEADDDPIKPSRIYGELRQRLERDAVVICDGGDFASYAGKFIEVFEPGGWLDTGPYGCLGNGLGYAIAARVVRPSSQVVLLLGDGAAGFSLMDVDSLVRHDLPVVMIVGNNGMWGLEKHPMQAIYGWDMACDLQPEMRYDEVVKALGGGGETVVVTGRDRSGARPCLRQRRAVPRQRPHRPGRRLPADQQPRLRRNPFGQVSQHLPMKRSTIDHDAGDLAGGDEPTGVGGRHGELQAAAVDLLEDRLGDHLGTDRRRLEMVELDAHTDRCGAVVEGVRRAPCSTLPRTARPGAGSRGRRRPPNRAPAPCRRR